MDKERVELHDTLDNITTLAVIGVVGFVGYQVWKGLKDFRWPWEDWKLPEIKLPTFPEINWPDVTRIGTYDYIDNTLDFGGTTIPAFSTEPAYEIPISTYVMPPALTYQVEVPVAGGGTVLETVHDYTLEVRTDPDMGQGAVSRNPRQETYRGGQAVTFSLNLFSGYADYWLVEQEGQPAYQVYGQEPTITIRGNTRVTAHIV